MVGKTNVCGGSGKLFAVIAVTYPEGSVCTCSNGTKTLKAKDTSGKALFNVSVGEWTVTATDGSRTKSASVSITADGQSKSVTLTYALVLFDNGAYAEETGGWSRSALSISATTTSMNGETDTVYTRNKISVSRYSTLHFQITSTSQTKNGYRRVGLSSGTSGADFSYYSEVAGAGEVIIPISSASTPLYVRMALEAWPPQNGQSATTSIVVSKVWLT